MHGLGSSLGVAIKNPTVLATVFHVDTALEHLNECVVVNLVTLDLGLLSESVRENGFSLNEGLNDLLGLQVDHTSLLGDDASEGGLTARLQANNGSSGPVDQVLGHGLTSLGVDRGLGDKLVLLRLVSEEVKSFTVEHGELLVLLGAEGSQGR